VNIEELVELIVCPKCHAKLSAVPTGADATGLSCQSCQLVYALEDGLPNMLISEARPLPGSENGRAHAGS
jgi:uncharacterized protein YbaR (Trm112 family)